jgi:hypothetical protein
MYQTILVANDVENGQRILDMLEKAGFLRVTAAFWFHFEDEDQWKLVIVSPDVSEKGPKLLYTMISTLLHALANDPERPLDFPLDRIRLLNPFSSLYKLVKQRTGLRVGPVREGLTLDVYIYKMS